MTGKVNGENRVIILNHLIIKDTFKTFETLQKEFHLANQLSDNMCSYSTYKILFFGQIVLSASETQLTLY